ncbi:hypothetical protein [Nonomuraea sp. SYSU D8015]|uniref:hypothetical protein n=1 Tax=Nonomuraea sp. SYSU D8015 TaxID=2593644 RepID=UPI001660B5F6|nr:hypothetical protein [Nonomuraea sp. SYSU D8015]
MMTTHAATTLRERVARALARRASGVKFSHPHSITLDRYWQLVLSERARNKYLAQADEIIAMVREEYGIDEGK